MDQPMSQPMNQNLGGQMLGHMQWANQQLFEVLSTIPDGALKFHASFDDWTIGRIAAHLAGVSGRLLARCTGTEMPVDATAPVTAAEILSIAAACAESDAKLVALGALPDELRTFDLFGETTTQMRSILLAQAVHHADQHRTQIAGILATHELDVMNLDKLSYWYFKNVLS